MFAEDNGCRRQWFNDPMGQRFVKIISRDEISHGVRGPVGVHVYLARIGRKKKA